MRNSGKKRKKSEIVDKNAKFRKKTKKNLKN